MVRSPARSRHPRTKHRGSPLLDDNRWVTGDRGANTQSLTEAQRTYVQTEAKDLLALGHVLSVMPSDRRDPEWRCVERADVEPYVSGTHYGATYPEDETRLYYWRRTYWRR